MAKVSFALDDDVELEAVCHFGFGAGSSHPFAAEDLADALDERWKHRDDAFALPSDGLVTVLSVSKSGAPALTAEVMEAGAMLGLDVVPAESAKTSLTALAETRIHRRFKSMAARLNFQGREVFALVDETFLQRIDEDRECKRKERPLPLVDCGMVSISEDDQKRIRVEIRGVVLRLSRHPLKLVEKLATKRLLRSLESDDEDWRRTICYALPDLTTPRRIVDLHSKAPKSGSSYDRWRPTSRSTEATFWSRLTGLPALADVTTTYSHADLVDTSGLPSFIAVPREFLLGETVHVPGATAIRSHAIESHFLRLLQDLPFVRDLSVDSPSRVPISPPVADPQAKASLTLFQKLLRRELRRAGIPDNNDDDDDPAQDKQAKLERKLARQRERERRELKRRMRDNTTLVIRWGAGFDNDNDDAGSVKTTAPQDTITEIAAPLLETTTTAAAAPDQIQKDKGHDETPADHQPEEEIERQQKLERKLARQRERERREQKRQQGRDDKGKTKAPPPSDDDHHSVDDDARDDKAKKPRLDPVVESTAPDPVVEGPPPNDDAEEGPSDDRDDTSPDAEPRPDTTEPRPDGHPSLNDDDEEVRKQAKLARKLARQRERERREQKREAKKKKK